MDFLVLGAGLAKGNRRLVGANELEIVKASLSGLVPAKVELAVAAVERGVGGNLGTPACQVRIHVKAIRFVTLDAGLPRLDDDAGLGNNDLSFLVGLGLGLGVSERHLCLATHIVYSFEGLLRRQA